MNPELADMLHGAGLGHLAGGFTKKSGFIRRLMAENALKHKGQYRNPTWELHPGSYMKAPAKFEYRRLANGDQRGSNESEYGASPFIQKHFGNARAVPFERKRGEAPPTEPYKSKRKSNKKSQESDEQKEARRAFSVAERNEPAPEAQSESESEEEEEEPKRKEEHSIPPAEPKEPEAPAPLPEGILSLNKTNEMIKKALIDNNQAYSLRYGSLTDKGKKAVERLYESIRFHVQHNENVRQLPPRLSHYGYSDLDHWAREHYRNELRQDDNWLLLYQHGVWDGGRWRHTTSQENQAFFERKQREWEENQRREFARQEEASKPKPRGRK